VALAAGFGTIVERPELALADGMRWIMCGGLALYFLVMGIAGLSGRAPRSWLLGWALPFTVAPIVIAAAGDALTSRTVLALFALCVAWMSVYGLSRHDLLPLGTNPR
jgi:hypothetical protein